MRRGFTLIELSVAICILLVVFSTSMMGIKYYRKYVDGIKYKEGIFEIKDFLGRVKGHAIKTNKVQKIYIEKQDGVYAIKSVEEDKVIDCLNLGDTWENISSNVIEVNQYGYIQSCSIILKRGNKTYTVKIQVGGNSINDYEEK